MSEGGQNEVEEHRSGQDRRSPGDAFVDTVKRADTGISLTWRWVQIAVTVGCAVFIWGKLYAGFEALQSEVSRLSTSVTALQKGQTEADKAAALQAQALATNTREVDRVSHEVSELRGQVNQMRDIREAMVYSGANAALRKLPSIAQPTVP